MLTKENMDDPAMASFKAMQNRLPGDVLFIRADPWHYIGEIVGVSATAYRLAPGAVWVAESGAFTALWSTGIPKSYAALPAGVDVNRAAVCDSMPWTFPIPKGGNI